ncbi:TPA: hypothetical protein I7E95_002551 [Vibrio cholerae]|uniref:hypothetical protein n=1 Tax=Vibrio cholerae TaxID=666 RepID=UPI000E67A340|nr:hypothetical protein [Vibrio cholerae]HAS5778593.1 hypothetical protein [Vibrio cholerae]
MKEYQYFIKVKAKNSLEIHPAVGKAFSMIEINEIKQILTSAIKDINVISHGSIIYLNSSNFKIESGALESSVLKVLPKMLTKKELSDFKKSETVKSEENKRLEQRALTIDNNHEVSDWIDKTFGENCFNNFNKYSLIKFLTGEDSVFNGLFNSQGTQVMMELGAIKNDKFDFDILKRKFEDEISKDNEIMDDQSYYNGCSLIRFRS